MYQNHMKSFSSGRWVSPSVSDAVGLGGGPRICFSKMFPGDAAAAGPV